MHKRAVKQLDKLSQWTGEKFFSESKTELSDEFQEFERDIELRRQGIERLHATSEAYHASLLKRKPTTDPLPREGQSPKDVFLPSEALGLVMSQHAEDTFELGATNDRRFPELLGKFGRAREKVSAAQELYAEKLERTYMPQIREALDVTKEYNEIRKKLDSRRLTLDAVSRKLKASKKENPALEQEVENAQARFDEIQEEVHEQMIAVQEAEGALIHQLEEFLMAELEYATSYQQILLDLKNEWGSSISKSTAPASSSTRPRSKSASVVGTKTLTGRAVNGASQPRTANGFTSRKPYYASPDDEDDDEPTPMKEKKLSGRDRSSSTASTGSSKGKKFVPSFGSFTKKSSSKLFSNPTKEKYGSLDEGDERSLQRQTSFDEDIDHEDIEEVYRPRPAIIGRTRSQSAVTSLSNLRVDDVVTTRDRKPSIRRNLTELALPTTHSSARLVKAKFDYNAKAADELSLHVGMIVQVTSEVNDDWWIGATTDGYTGIFPASYSEPYDEDIPTLPARVVRGPPQPVAMAPVIDVGDTADEATTDDDDHDDHDQSRSPFSKPANRSRSASGSAGLGLSNSGVGSPGRNRPPPPPVRRNNSSFSYAPNVSSSVPGSTSDSKMGNGHSNGNGNGTGAMLGNGNGNSNGNGNGNMSSASKFSPPAGAHRMLVPTNIAAGRSRINGGSPFGGSDDEAFGQTTGKTTIPDCKTCGCDE